MGWSEEQALRTDVNAILVAYEGRNDMLKAIFGGGGGDDNSGEDTSNDIRIGQPMTTALFDAVFGGG